MCRSVRRGMRRRYMAEYGVFQRSDEGGDVARNTNPMVHRLALPYAPDGTLVPGKGWVVSAPIYLWFVWGFLQGLALMMWVYRIRAGYGL